MILARNCLLKHAALSRNFLNSHKEIPSLLLLLLLQNNQFMAGRTDESHAKGSSINYLSLLELSLLGFGLPEKPLGTFLYGHRFVTVC